MDLADGWFCFERPDEAQRPVEFQSVELDNLFLENPEVRIKAAWCISCSDRRLVYFWGDRSIRSVRSTETTADGRYGYYLRKFRPMFDIFSDARGSLLSSALFEHGGISPIKYVASKRVAGNFLVDIYAGRGFIFFYAISAETNLEDLGRRAFLLGRSERGHRFCREAKRFFDRIPKSILRVDLESELLFQQFYGPNAFDPEKEPNVPFMWPWQRCIEIRDATPHPREINTISLVMDIRNSSSAMLLTADPPKFAVFIDKVIEAARDAIIENGGYFDKDTGDGVVGHFDLTDSSHTENETTMLALTAARAISNNTTRLCENYQQNLSLPLGGLGCALGLFSGKAVWLMSWTGVRAIGSAVVNASRICANAGSGEIGYCNAISKLMASDAVASGTFSVKGSRRAIKVSEIRESALPEAFFLKLN